MTENPTPVPLPAPPATLAPPAPPVSPASTVTESSAPRVPLKDRLFNLRAVIAVAAAGVIIGAGAGAGVTALAGQDGGSDRAGFGPGRMPDGGFQQIPGMQGGPGSTKSG